MTFYKWGWIKKPIIQKTIFEVKKKKFHEMEIWLWLWKGNIIEHV